MIGDAGNALIKERTRILVCQTPDILHDEKGGAQFIDQAEKVQQQASSWVIGVTTPNVAKTLAGRATEKPIYLAANYSFNFDAC